MSSILDKAPYPWANPTACELHTRLCQARPTVNFALAFARMAGLDPALIRSDQAPYFVWFDVLEQAATAGKTYWLVSLVHDSLDAQSPVRRFLKGLLNGETGLIPPGGEAGPLPAPNQGRVPQAFQSRRPKTPLSSRREAILFDNPVVADGPPEPVAQFLPESLPPAQGTVHALVAHYQADVESALYDAELVLSGQETGFASDRELVWIRGEDVWESPPSGPGDPDSLLVARLVSAKKFDPANFGPYLDEHPADFLLDFSRFGVWEINDLATPQRNQRLASTVWAVRAFAQTAADRGCRVVTGLPRILLVNPEWRDVIGRMTCRFAAPLFSPGTPSPDPEFMKPLHPILREGIRRLLRSNSVALRNFLRQEANRLAKVRNWTDDAASKEVLILATKLANEKFLEPAYRLEVWHRTRVDAATPVPIAADVFPPKDDQLLRGTLDDIRDLPGIVRPESVPIRAVLTGESGQGKTVALQQTEHRWALPGATVPGGAAPPAWLPLYLDELSDPAADVRKAFEAPLRKNGKLKAHELLARVVTAENIGWVFGSPLLLLIDQIGRPADGDLVGEWITALIRANHGVGLLTAYRSLEDAPTEFEWFSEAWGNPPLEARLRALDWNGILAIWPGDEGRRIARILSQIDRPLSDLAGNRFLVTCLAEIGADEVPRWRGLFDLLDQYVRGRLQGESANVFLGELTGLAGDVPVEGQAAQERRQRAVRQGINHKLIDRESQRFVHPLLNCYFLARHLAGDRRWAQRWTPSDDAMTDLGGQPDHLFRMLTVCLPAADRDEFIRWLRDHKGDMFAHRCLLELPPDEYKEVLVANEIRNGLVGHIDALRPNAGSDRGTGSAEVKRRSAAEALGYYDPRIPPAERPLDGFVPLGTPDHPDYLQIGRFPVTNLEYIAFIADGGYSDTSGANEHWLKNGREWRNREGVTAPRFWHCREYNRPNSPVVGVSFHEAVAYARWLTARLTGPEVGRWEFALPTRVEWWAAVRPASAPEPASAAPGDLLGQVYEEVQLILNRYVADLYTPGNLPVGLLPPSPAGVYDLIGNVWQFCDEWFPANADSKAPSADASRPGPVIVCGGPVSGPARVVAALMGSAIDQYARVLNIGFRLVARRLR